MSIEDKAQEVISRMAARSAGLLRYFTGIPCSNGHICERQVSSGNCLQCSAERKRASRKKDPEKHRVAASKWWNENKDKANARRAQRHANAPERRKEESQRWYRKYAEVIRAKSNLYGRLHREEKNRKQREINARNPLKNRAWAKLRSAAKKQAVPPWYSEIDSLVWEEATDLVHIRSDATGIKWEADHMIPLRAKSARGLHVWNNCQVIPARLNSAKKNKMELTEPLEWLQFI